jgi:transcriptional regulator with XRE-family HTH domain
MRAGGHESESPPGHKTRAQLARHLGTVARAARQGLGLTQEEVAERLGVAAEVYARIERGRALPRVTNLRNLCCVLRVDAGALLGTARAGESAPLPEPTPHPAPEASDSPLLRRLLRRARTLPGNALRALCRMAHALGCRRTLPTQGVGMPTAD